MQKRQGAVCLDGLGPATEEPWIDWGAGMGLTLADGGIWDGSLYSGFAFTAVIDSTEPVTIELHLDLKVEAPHEMTISPGANHVGWADVVQPDWVEQIVEFDPSRLESIQFRVPRSQDVANDFELCVSELRVLP